MNKLNYNQLAAEIHANSLRHGWWENQPSAEHFITLVICELAEAVEADRIGKRANIQEFEAMRAIPATDHEAATEAEQYAYWFEAFIKDSVEDELADATIRLLDLAGAYKYDMGRVCLAYVVNEKKTFTENIYAIIKELANYKYSQEEQLNYVLLQIQELTRSLGIDLGQHIRLKMRYNASRPYKHGKAY